MTMKISYSMLFNFAFAAILLVSPFVVGITSSAWDPWLDTNEDGIIDITDIATIISNYGTMGDTTKNVNVTNWPIERTLNASLAENLVIPDGETVFLFANVDGYSKVTLVLAKTPGTLWALICYYIGGVRTPYVYTNNSLTSSPYFILRNHEVIGPTIMIELVAVGSQQTVSLGIYASD